MLSERKTVAGMLDGREDKKSGEETVWGWGCELGMVEEEMESMWTKEGRPIPNTDSGTMDTKGDRRQAGRK